MITLQAGQVKAYNELTLVLVENSGHQVPFYVPHQVTYALFKKHNGALDLFNRFINNKPFD